MKHIKNTGGRREVLDLLGVRNSSVFLSNCVIWTEGVTERMLLRELFASFANITSQYKEDRHYTFSEYGGGNLEHFDFVFDDEGVAQDDASQHVNALGKTNFLIADNDGKTQGAKSKKYQRLETLRDKVFGGNNFFLKPEK